MGFAAAIFRAWVYPRACGGTSPFRYPTTSPAGLSPRMRGNPRGEFDARRHEGSIPAHAGEPTRHTAPRRSRRVYPRACGGTRPTVAPPTKAKGLSPRMRGNRTGATRTRAGCGSIPAHAGEPVIMSLTPSHCGVYPRACGGTRSRELAQSGTLGLSPRMRGNPSAWASGRIFAGSIPAHAGEPLRETPYIADIRVYPRACGGTAWKLFKIWREWGLSPRMRGNPVESDADLATEGSIPAHAGEPPASPGDNPPSGVYPRACGGTTRTEEGERYSGVLSPRMRGNHYRRSDGRGFRGSIPAHAGEPNHSPRLPESPRVYPRACGGTSRCGLRAVRIRGLSPRMRGNREVHLHHPAPQGSIPAHAGEPATSPRATWRSWVYPRACGGTWPEAIRCSPSLGLSPRMRGNLFHGAGLRHRSGSIPAHAGEPGTGSIRARVRRVYPRACGGTDLRGAEEKLVKGLSPRMRGNRTER